MDESFEPPADRADGAAAEAGGEPPLGKRERNKREKRARILEAARTVFASKGFAGATTQEIAALAGVASGTVFLYAPSKEALLLQCASRDLEAIVETALGDIWKRRGTLEKLMRVVDGLIGYHLELGPELSTVMLRELMSGSRENRIDRQPKVGRPGELMAEVMLRAKAKGELADGVDPIEAADTLFSVFYWELSHWAVGRLPGEDLSRLVRSRFGLCLKGVAAR